MEKYTITEINASTGEEITRQMTESEISDIENAVKRVASEIAAKQAQENTKKAIAQRLGITPDELISLIS